MKVLYISYQDPFGVGGGCFASHAYLKAFSQIANGNIDIVIAKECNMQNDDSLVFNEIFRIPRRGKLKRFFSIIDGTLHRYNDIVKELLKKNKYDYVVFSGCLMGSTLANEAIKRGAVVITIHHNYEPEYFRDNMPNGLKKKLFIFHVRRAESRAYRFSDINMFLSCADMRKFEEVYGKCKGKNSLIATFEYGNSRININNIGKTDHSKFTFVITGTLSTYQGIDGVHYFFSELYKYLPEGSKVIVAGASPTNEVVNLCSKYNNVELIGNPVNMDEIIERADIYICPTRLGGGVKLRVMDGLRNGIPVITHDCSSRGYDMFFDTPMFKVFGSPDDFEKKLNILLNDMVKGLIDKNFVCNLYKQHFSLESGKERIKKILGI